MLAHYFHIRREAMRGASGAVAQAPSPMEIPADVHQNGARALALRGTASASCWVCLVGLGRVELPTSPLSGVRSSHLSYRPVLPREGNMHRGLHHLRERITSIGRRQFARKGKRGTIGALGSWSFCFPCGTKVVEGRCGFPHLQFGSRHHRCARDFEECRRFTKTFFLTGSRFSPSR